MGPPNADAASGPLPPPGRVEVGLPVRLDGASSDPNGRDHRQLSLKRRLHQHLLAALPAGRMERLSEAELRLDLGRLAEELAHRDAEFLGLADLETLVEQVLNEVFG